MKPQILTVSVAEHGVWMTPTPVHFESDRDRTALEHVLRTMVRKGRLTSFEIQQPAGAYPTPSAWLAAAFGPEYSPRFNSEKYRLKPARKRTAAA